VEVPVASVAHYHKRAAGGLESNTHLERSAPMESWIGWIIVGGIAGWLAGKLMKGGGFGVIVNVLLGIVGSVIGGWLFGLLGITVVSGFIGSLASATVGAIVLLAIVGLFKK